MDRKGFTLIEMLLVVIILAILAGLSLPVLVKSIERARVDEAKSNLDFIRIAQKQYFLVNNTFSSDIDSLDIENPDSPSSRYFDYTIQSADASDFTARAARRSNAPSPYNTYYYEISREGTISSFPSGNPF